MSKSVFTTVLSTIVLTLIEQKASGKILKIIDVVYGEKPFARLFVEKGVEAIVGLSRSKLKKLGIVDMPSPGEYLEFSDTGEIVKKHAKKPRTFKK